MQRRQFLQSLAQSRLLANPLGRRGLLGLGLLGATAGHALAQNAVCTCGNCPDCLQGGNTTPPAVAFYYGARIPVDDLRAFDWVVLEPQHALAQDTKMVSTLGPDTLALAYVSVGEVTADRPYYADMPKAWLPASNAAWGSKVIDQTAAGWPQFLRERIVKPLWDAGFRAFFLDTLDSYQLLAKSPQAQQQQAKALAETLRGLVAAYPGIRLMLNRGFELVDATLAPSILAVAAESLYRGWNQAETTYVEVKADDREWLLARFGDMRSRFKLPGIAIDYCAPQDRAAARQTAQQIAAQGLIPWVADPALESLGVGTVELVPRRVLLLHSCEQGDSPELQAQSAHLYGAMPLEYLGLVPEYRYVGAPAITEPLAGRYAAVVLYPDDGKVPGDIRTLLKRAKAEGVPVAVLGYADLGVLDDLGEHIGEPLNAPIKVQRQPGTPNGEVIPLISPQDTVQLTASAGLAARHRRRWPEHGRRRHHLLGWVRARGVWRVQSSGQHRHALVNRADRVFPRGAARGRRPYARHHHPHRATGVFRALRRRRLAQRLRPTRLAAGLRSAGERIPRKIQGAHAGLGDHRRNQSRRAVSQTGRPVAEMGQTHVRPALGGSRQPHLVASVQLGGGE
ncbi:endo alpha-1,4 polygalactosaminidase [Thiomonas sp. 13-64-67]|uniref:endo alpha-1,4 polygalactosaminidase n=1 Tax=Thiomonas sp. 13-64-67 TaxID=1970447 RepID=UPI0025794528|nr:endo alpha-1,4 polygalactosaminidase [Thiomonas sp. 13-64-67]